MVPHLMQRCIVWKFASIKNKRMNLKDERNDFEKIWANIANLRYMKRYIYEVWSVFSRKLRFFYSLLHYKFLIIYIQFCAILYQYIRPWLLPFFHNLFLRYSEYLPPQLHEQNILIFQFNHTNPHLFVCLKLKKKYWKYLKEILSGLGI